MKIYLFKIILILLFSSFFSIAYSQHSETSSQEMKETYSLSSPDVYAFEKHQVRGVDNYTGKVDINVPIFEITTGNINYPIALNYDASGIKVDQRASEVGLGWSINKSIITRTVNGFNDFNNSGSHGLLSTSEYDATDSQNGLEVYTMQKNRIGYFLQKKTGKVLNVQDRFVDFLPDTYNFYSAGVSSNFFFKDINTPVELNPQNFKITATKSRQRFNPQNFLKEFSSTDFYKIEIVTNQGIKYIFNDYDVSISYNRNLDLYETLNDYVNADPAQVSAWHISEIIDLHTNKKIKFHYDYVTDVNTFQDRSTFNLWKGGFYDAEMEINYFKTLTYSSNNGTDCKDYYYKSRDGYYVNGNYLSADLTARVDVRKAVLKRIEYDKGDVFFEYNNSNNIANNSSLREDVYKAKFITSVIIKNKNNEVVNKYDLNYDYFRSPVQGYFNLHSLPTKGRYERLKLKSVKSINTPKYEFSYHEENQMPPVNSFSMDYMGYFNNSPDISDLDQLQSLKPVPKLYVYANNFEKTLLPFKLNSSVIGGGFTLSNQISGYFNREANEYSKTWSLKEIKYPNGGFSKFEYESNDFYYKSTTIKGGGIRIKKQTINNGEGQERNIVYTYKKNNISTGSLIHFPYFGHPTRNHNNVLMELPRREINVDEDAVAAETPLITGPTYINTTQWKIYSKNNLRTDVLSNSFVDYSNVFEHEQSDASSKEYVYSSSSNFDYRDRIVRSHGQNFRELYNLGSYYMNFGNHDCLYMYIITNSAMGADYFTSNAYKRGKLLELNYYNNNNLLLKKIVNTYQDVKLSDNKFFLPITNRWDTNNEQNYGILFVVYKNYKSANFRLLKSETFNYDYNVQNKTSQEFVYKGATKIPQMKKEFNSEGEETQFKYYYSDDVTANNVLPNGTLSNNEYNDYLKLKNINNVTTPIQIDVLKKVNNSFNIVKSNRIVYKDWGNNINLPEKYLSKVTSFGNYTVDYTILRRNTLNGNILEDKDKNLVSSYLWGYNNNYVIGKLQNVAYNTLLASPYATISENTIEANFANLVTYFPNSLISAQLVKPLVGMSLKIHSNGKKERFIYDGANRLSFVLDTDGNIIHHYKYNFKTN